MSTTFDLGTEDEIAIQIAKNVVRRFLREPRIEATQVIALGRALYALDRLPLATPETNHEFGITYGCGTHELHETVYITFRITESEFEISKGGSVREEGIGSDSYTGLNYFLGINGSRTADGDLYGLEDSIDEYLKMGAKITASGEE